MFNEIKVGAILRKQIFPKIQYRTDLVDNDSKTVHFIYIHVPQNSLSFFGGILFLLFLISMIIFG